MLRPHLPRSVRTGAALLGVAGMLGLAGCTAAVADDESDETTSDASTESSSESTEASDAETDADDAASGDTTYADGTYTATGSYVTPESVEEITVTITLEDDVVSAVEVTGSPTNAESEQYQSQFIGGISDVVVGQDVDTLDVSRVAGSSLTSSGFNDALATILAEAAA